MMTFNEYAVKSTIALLLLIVLSLTVSADNQLPVQVGTKLTYQFVQINPDSGLSFLGATVKQGDAFVVSVNNNKISNDMIQLNVLINGQSQTYNDSLQTLLYGSFLLYPNWASLESYSNSSGIVYQDQGNTILFAFKTSYNSQYDVVVQYLYNKIGYLEAERQDVYPTGTTTNPVLQIEFDLQGVSLGSILDRLSIQNAVSNGVNIGDTNTYAVNEFQAQSWNGLSNLKGEFSIQVVTSPKSNGDMAIRYKDQQDTQVLVQNINNLGSFIISNAWDSWGFLFSDFRQQLNQNETFTFSVNGKGLTLSYQNLQDQLTETLQVTYSNTGVLQKYKYFKLDGQTITSIDISIKSSGSSLNYGMLSAIVIVLAALSVAAYVYRVPLSKRLNMAKEWSSKQINKTKSKLETRKQWNQQSSNKPPEQPPEEQ